jgi:ElaB/YqjD/DUF883 family membrane-anchored ribosome-binding protein
MVKKSEAEELGSKVSDRSTIDDVISKAEDLYESAESSLQSGIKASRKLIKNNSTESVLIGVGVGFIVGFIVAKILD